MTAIIYCDGGCSGNGTNNAKTYGSFSIDGQIHRCEIDGATNNEAEYLTLVQALLYCRAHGIQAPQVYSDSQLVVNQVAGGWKVKKAELKPLCDQVRQLWRELRAGLAWVPRETIVEVLGH